jgi:hypothetical protein
MWTSGALLAAATVAALFVLRPPVTAQDKEKPPRVKWEYKSVAQDKLGKLGDQGWEVFAVTGGQPYVESSAVHTPELALRGVPKQTTTNKVKFAPLVYHLKRPK